MAVQAHIQADDRFLSVNEILICPLTLQLFFLTLQLFFDITTFIDFETPF